MIVHMAPPALDDGPRALRTRRRRRAPCMWTSCMLRSCSLGLRPGPRGSTRLSLQLALAILGLQLLFAFVSATNCAQPMHRDGHVMTCQSISCAGTNAQNCSSCLEPLRKLQGCGWCGTRESGTCMKWQNSSGSSNPRPRPPDCLQSSLWNPSSCPPSNSDPCTRVRTCARARARCLIMSPS
jgi:hypothetical protein